MKISEYEAPMQLLYLWLYRCWRSPRLPIELPSDN